ncbi:hypothetical protein ES332_A13G043200v1 [Gossypium tomentosum]|uniref:Uncharacterized protein n=1 Tax=Gossypium tomentosum TaxID=34277 RepID=A0A5D2MG63_GOSTO|nr:hypothetical protein ES332_A13G043200v1 [Gossypium tomentosum]
MEGSKLIRPETLFLCLCIFLTYSLKEERLISRLHLFESQGKSPFSMKNYPFPLKHTSFRHPIREKT